MNPSNSPSSQRHFNTRLGLMLFVVYSLLYLAFVLINAFAADQMDRIVIAGLNLAIVYGFGLILVAVGLAFIYGLLCRSEPAEVLDSSETSDDGGNRE